MSFEKFNGNIDAQIERLIDQGKHFGKGGSLAVFRENYLQAAKDDLAYGEVGLAMQYINVMYSAMTAAAKGSTFEKMRRIPILAIRLNWWAQEVLLFEEGSTSGLPVQQLQMLLAVFARTLQVLQKMHLLWLFKEKQEYLNDDIKRILEILQKRAQEAKGLHQDLTGLETVVDLLPAELSLLMAQATLFELHTDALYTLSSDDAQNIRLKVWLNAKHYSGKKNMSRDDAQVAARLFRAIGLYEDAEKVALQANNLDQARKAQM